MFKPIDSRTNTNNVDDSVRKSKKKVQMEMSKQKSLKTYKVQSKKVQK